jgi:hypothetical protein
MRLSVELLLSLKTFGVDFSMQLLIKSHRVRMFSDTRRRGECVRALLKLQIYRSFWSWHMSPHAQYGFSSVPVQSVAA